MPKFIMNDRDAVFTSQIWSKLFHLQGTQLNLSTAYYPQTDGQTKVINQSLEWYLRCFTREKPKEWSK